MAARDRRKARRASEEARQRAHERIEGRTEKLHASAPADDVEQWLFTPTALWQRRDIEAIFRGYRRSSTKQRDKHLGKRLARIEAARARQLYRAAVYLTGATKKAPAQVTTVRGYGGVVPAEAWGDAVLAGESVVWYLRYRYDAAYLEVGYRDEGVEDDCGRDAVVGHCLLAASVRRVTGQPYAASFTDLGSESDALGFIAQLFRDLQPPEPRTRFQDRLSNTVDLLCGGGDEAAPTLMDP